VRQHWREKKFAIEGGDVLSSVNVLDELRCLTVNEIEFRSFRNYGGASGAGAYAGIP
jgi:hypothetical protein